MQISNYMESLCQNFSVAFEKVIAHSIAFCLCLKRAVDNGKVYGILLTDLSKAFDCLSHELLLARLHTCEFSISALRLI